MVQCIRKLFHGFKYLRDGYKQSQRLISSSNVSLMKILGIETSCDDTGCAIVDENGKILGESLESQQDIHVENGGILPPLARDLHKENITNVVNRALANAKLQISDLDAIAVTVKPGLALSLLVGMNHGKNLAKEFNKPFIPIHHMEAHALTVRMTEQVDFPFLVLLISGGHCLLAVAEDIDRFKLLGYSLDDAPGEALDKIARRLKLNNKSEWKGMSGGKAMGAAAEGGDPKEFQVAEPLLHSKDCNFSFAGIKNSTRAIVMEQEELHNVEGDELLPGVSDLCASVQYAMAKHLCRRVQRGIAYAAQSNLIATDNPTMVVSGGVAASPFFRQALTNVCFKFGCRVIAPPPNLCTDNGAMIAWNGIERFRKNRGIILPDDLDSVDMQPKCPFGHDISEKVRAANIKSSPIKYADIYGQAEAV